jgi:DNA-binding MarR family transcriptional regulator
MSSNVSYNDHLGHTIKRLYLLMGQYFNAVLRPYGVTVGQWYMLNYIYHSTGLTQNALQEVMQVKSATLTAALNALERKGWITRQQSETDHRVKIVALTPAGKALWETLPEPIAEIRKQMLKGISSEEERTARSILDKAIQNLEQIL